VRVAGGASRPLDLPLGPWRGSAEAFLWAVVAMILVLPLFAPPVIFGGGALTQLAAGLPWTSGLALLAGWTAAAVALSPLAMAAACRNAVD
jgi:ABC-type transport system involved in cytochrome c biogenesis permease component